MSRSAILPAILAAVLVPAALSAQSYTWQNVQIVGGGFVPGIIFNPTERRPHLRPHRHRRRLPVEPDHQAAGSRCSTGSALGRLGPERRRTAWPPTRSTPTGCTWPSACTPTPGTNNGAILRSTDKGDTWQPYRAAVQARRQHAGPRHGRAAGRRPEPRTAILYLGARSGNGLWRSTDFGATWAKVTSFPNVGNYVQDPNDPNGYLSDQRRRLGHLRPEHRHRGQHHARRSTSGWPTSGTSVYRSTDGGATWDRGCRAADRLHAAQGRPGLERRPLHRHQRHRRPVRRRRRATCGSSTPATGAWTQISPIPSSSTDDYFGYSGLTIDRSTRTRSWSRPTSPGGRTPSSGGAPTAGATWTRIWDFGGYPRTNLALHQDITAVPWLTLRREPAPPEITPKLGWMIGLEIDPFDSNRMMYGTGATIYGTDNLTTWDTGGRSTSGRWRRGSRRPRCWT